MARHPESFFAYNLSRQYPFRWFTPVAIVGGVLAFFAVSVLNIVTNGFELKAVSRTNPNETLSSDWTNSWPEWLVSTRGSCDDLVIPLRTRMYTNHTAFMYTLESVWTLDSNKARNYSPSLVYRQQPLHSCHITAFNIEIDAADDRPAGDAELTPVGVTVEAMVLCAIESEAMGGRTYVKLFTSYSSTGPASGSQLPGIYNRTTQPTFYWGRSLIRMYWGALAKTSFHASESSLPTPITHTVIKLKLRDTTATTEEVDSVDFFSVGCYAIELNATSINNWVDVCKNNDTITEMSNSDLMPGIWRPAGILGKATYFLILADLGRHDNVLPNPLANATLLANLSKNMALWNSTLKGQDRRGIDDGTVAQTPFDPNFQGASQLGVTPAVLGANYLCQIPTRKSTGSLIMSVLIADIVLLHSIWSLYKFAVDQFYLSKVPGAQRCEGCAGQLGDDTVELLSRLGADQEAGQGGRVGLLGMKKTYKRLSVDGDSASAMTS